jgi:hypothetical protein
MTGFPKSKQDADAGVKVCIHLPPAKSRANSGTDVEGRRVGIIKGRQGRAVGKRSILPLTNVSAMFE